MVLKRLTTKSSQHRRGSPAIAEDDVEACLSTERRALLLNPQSPMEESVPPQLQQFTPPVVIQRHYDQAGCSSSEQSLSLRETSVCVQLRGEKTRGDFEYKKNPVRDR